MLEICPQVLGLSGTHIGALAAGRASHRGETFHGHTREVLYDTGRAPAAQVTVGDLESSGGTDARSEG